MATVSCGTLLAGRVFSIGETLSGVQVSRIDYTKEVTDDFGTTYLVERPYKIKVTGRVAIQGARTDAIMDALAAVRATPTLYLIDDDFSSLAPYGWCKTFDVDLALKTGISFASFEVQSLSNGS